MSTNIVFNPFTGNFDLTSIPDQSITNAQLAPVTSQTFKGRSSAFTGPVQDLNATQATAILNEFAGDSGAGAPKGLVPPADSGDATKFLRGDATWQPVLSAPTMTNYTPLIVGLGSPTNINFTSVQIGNFVFISGFVSVGIGDASELQIPLPAGLTIDPALWDPSLTHNVALATTTSVNGAGYTVLASGGDTFLNMGILYPASVVNSLSPQSGNIFANGTGISFTTGPIPVI